MVQAKLLDIAIREFGAKGLDGASTRGIAAAAGTAMSSITYHYGGKDGLYLAAAEHIGAELQAEMGPAFAAERARAGEAEDPAEARAAVHRLLDRFLDKMASESSADWSLFIVREQMNPTAAFHRIYDQAMGPMLRALAELVCTATGSRDAIQSRIVTLSFMGQVLALRASRASCLALLERPAIEGDLLDAYRARLASNIDAILDRLTAEQRGTS